MTAIELRTSIGNDLQHFNEEMLLSVSRYVKSLAARTRVAKTTVRKAETGLTKEKKIKLLLGMQGIAKDTIAKKDLETDERLAYILRNNP